jgi:rhodanese-related sulfurtransferase
MANFTSIISFIMTKRILMPLLVFIMSACNNVAQTSGELDVNAFEKAITDKNIQLLDVRTAGEFGSGHLGGALQADWTDRSQFMDRTSHLDPKRPVFVYCLSGGRSAAAAEYLRSKGFQVTNMTGGISAWNRAGKPLDGATKKPETAAAEYDRLTKSAPTVIIDFGADWCPPCRKMEPVLASFMQGKSEAVVKLVKMDGGVETSLMKTLGVMALPTFILYRNGVEEKRFQGVKDAAEWEKWVYLKD